MIDTFTLTKAALTKWRNTDIKQMLQILLSPLILVYELEFVTK